MVQKVKDLWNSGWTGKLRIVIVGVILAGAVGTMLGVLEGYIG